MRSTLNLRHIPAAVFLGAVLMLAGLSPAAAASQCMPRFIAKNIQEAVMALTAARYCDGMPYSIGEAAARVELMRGCNDEASARIDDMLNGQEAKYRTIYTRDPAQTACQTAAAIIFN